ncbi:hypothetical protein TRIUR3_10848 [Triticum urartu]|uniref:Uncharacterized protein n=1 Tax=Triticum urartu TaxID=4572 RepID=M7ZPM0_TRIUA|nr:hypothetical protein TRIUR3_10848 [Triticum urartu]
MLGFLHNEYRRGNRFVSTSTFRRTASHDHRDCHVLDSRHGLALLYAPGYHAPFDVCDLVTDNWREIDDDPKCHNIMHWLGDDPDDYYNGSIHCNATVFCAIDRCDHLDCHGGPFLVALVGSADEGDSSETRQWSDMISVQTPGLQIDTGGRTAVVGNNKVYVPNYEGDSVVEYNIREQQLSVIKAPEILDQGYLDLLGVEDGMLLFASVRKPRLYLWSMEAGPGGAAAWTRRRVVELEPLLPPRALLDMSSSDVWTVGFAEGVRVLVLLYAPAYQVPLDACDLVANKWWEIEAVPRCGDTMHWHDIYEGVLHCNATVLCARDRCDHLDCHGGGPFLVALVGSADEGGIALATAYSSETREWSDKISVRSPGLQIDDGGHTAVVGNKVYVPSYECDSVVEYNIREQTLSVINVPESLDEAHLDLIARRGGRHAAVRVRAQAQTLSMVHGGWS